MPRHRWCDRDHEVGRGRIAVRCCSASYAGAILRMVNRLDIANGQFNSLSALSGVCRALVPPDSQQLCSPTLMSTPISIVVIEDNLMLREGLTTLIHQQGGFMVLAASANVLEAVQRVREAKPQIVLVAFGLQNHDSLRVTATLHREVPAARVIVMGLFPLQEDVADFVRAGASGFVMKDAPLADFLETIRRVANGKDVLPTQLTQSLFTQIVEQAVAGGKSPVLGAVKLTHRERQVVDLIGDGLSNKEIAAQLHLAVHTVKSHVHNVLEKLALHTRLEVAAFTRTSGGRASSSRIYTSS
jgi:DNA-binding NarL/FixJ family response regulator